MESMDNFRERFEALEQQTEQLRQQTQTLEAQTHTLARQARWWRGIAPGLGEPATANGVGNMIVGYNELRGPGTDKLRIGSPINRG